MNVLIIPEDFRKDQYSRVRSRCEEDIESLENSLKNWLGGSGRSLG